MSSAAAEITKRLDAMQNAGWCTECRCSPIAAGSSRTSQAARKYGLCGRCYNDRAVRLRHKRAANVAAIEQADRVRLAELGVVEAVRRVQRKCNPGSTLCQAECRMTLACKALWMLDVVTTPAGRTT